MTLAPAHNQADPPETHRRCIVTGELHERAALMRFVVSPEGELVPDVAGRLPGRGLWLTPRRDIVDRAVAKRLFARAARRPISAPPGLADRIEALLAQRCCDTLGLARRAGQAIAGFERVADAARHGKVGLLVFALDAAEAGRRRVAALGREVPAAGALTGAELGAAFGRDRVAHAAVAPGPFADRLAADMRRIAGFRAGVTIVDEATHAPTRSGERTVA
ncbi:MAG TPA: RNA-binding protein [Stellaceae bacterium]